ncbi:MULTISPECIES: hypothetical protein [unclassified Polaribacter]|uniref:hypothetical protein n=1 Tax=unclassified Polaribacter TaxID=196858 RepID=UPI0011BE9F19|nr:MULTISPECIES: hypothetical protein [unclassified Polaribacter]TXD50338.1 hypothetical protein ES043_16470 [Polaribacter sp. IC063]TXD57183.1 hypothetical protein ES044_15545 [Polaribacter sp. IC066]
MNSNHENLKGITNSILELEHKYNLLGLEIDGVFVWQACRSIIYLRLLDVIVPNNIDYIKPRVSVFKLLKKINQVLFSRNPFFDFEKSDALVFRSGRNNYVDGKYLDIYTSYFREDLESDGVKCQEYILPSVDYRIKVKNDISRNLDFINLVSKVKSKLIRVKFTTTDLELINKIEKELKKALGASLNLREVFKQEIIRFKSQYPLYKLLFKLKRANQIYLISSVDKCALIKAAKDCGIVVNELQHGLITKEGLIANYPYTKEDSLEYFPNKFYIWNNLNMYTSKLPLSDKNIVKFPNKHLEYLLQKNKKKEKKKNQILIVSQPYNSKEILEYLSCNLSELREWKIIYKLHPVEDFNIAMRIMEPLISEFDNLTLVNNEASVYDLFSESTYVIGVFSTAVFEAPLFGCKVLLLDLTGVEMSESLIIAGQANLVKLDEPLLNYLALV